MLIKWSGNARNQKFSYEIKLLGTVQGMRENERTEFCLFSTGLDSFHDFCLVGKHSRMPSSLFSIKLLVGELGRTWRWKLREELIWGTEKFQKKFRIHILVFVCLFGSFLGGEGPHYSRFSSFTLPKILHKYKYSRKCTYYEMIMP